MKQKYVRRATATAIAIAAAVGLTIPTAFSAAAYSPGVQSVYTAQNAAACNKNPCVLYPKSAQLPSGRIVAAYEDSESTVVGQTLPIQKTDDYGVTWQKLADVKAPAFLSTDPKYAKYTSNWTNPYLYTLPQAVGNLGAGTLLLASIVSGDDAWYNEHKAADPNWTPSGDGDRRDLAVALYSSTDQGATWKVENIITTGTWQGGSAGAIGRTAAANTTAQVDPVWEPYLMVYNNQLVAYYSDENDYLGYDPSTGVPILDPANDTASDSHGQILAHRTWDGTSAGWSQPVVDVAGLTEDRGNGKTQIGGGRPGMETIVPTTDGKWLLTYEYFGGGDNVHYKIADDPTRFFAAGGDVGSNITALPSTGPRMSTGGSPVLTRFPDGRIVYNAAGSGNVWVNESGRSDGAWKAYQTPIDGGYSRNLQYVEGTGQLMILQASWAGGSVGPIKHADVDLGRSTGSYYTIVNRATGQVLSTDANKTQDPPFTGWVPDLITWDKAAVNDTQRWHVVTKGSSVSFLNKAGGRSVAIWEGVPSAGQRLTQWVDDNATDKLWNLVPSSDGYVKIQATGNTGMYWTGARYGVTTLANAIGSAGDPSSDDAQEWLLVEDAPLATTLTAGTRSTALIGADPVGVGTVVPLDASAVNPGGAATHANTTAHAYVFTESAAATDLGAVALGADQKGTVTLPSSLAVGTTFRIALTFGATATMWDEATVQASTPARTVATAVSASTRCVAGKVVLTATATNNHTAPSAITITTAFGAKSFTGVAPGKSVSSATTTRETEVAAGTVTVRATGTVNGSTVTSEFAAPYAAANCR